MWTRLTRPAAYLALAVSSFALFAARPAHAVPQYGNNITNPPASSYATVIPTLLPSAAGTYKYGFAVSVPSNTPALAGLKGLLVGVGPTGGSVSPTAMSVIPNGSSKPGNPSWWDYQGGPDYNANGIPDTNMEPGESFPATLHTLTFNRVIPDSAWQFTFHVIRPGGKTFFSDRTTTPAPARLTLEVMADRVCVVSGSTITYTYKLCNTGQTGAVNVVLTDSFGVVSTPATIAANTCITATRTTTVTTASATKVNSVTATWGDAVLGGSIPVKTVSGGITTTVSHPSLLVSGPASISIATGGTKQVTYTITNSGDVAVTNLALQVSATGGTATVGAPTKTALAPDETAQVVVSYTGTGSDGSIILTGTAKEACGCANITAQATTTTDSLTTGLAVVGSNVCTKPGGSPTLTFTITNTGEATVNGLVAGTPTSTTGAGSFVVGALSTTSLAPNAYVSVTVKVNGPNNTGIVTLPVSGTEAVSGGPVAASGNGNLQVISPSLDLRLTPITGTLLPGQTFTVHGTYQNNGDADLRSVILVLAGDGGLGSETLQIGDVAVGSGVKSFSAQFTVPTSTPAGTTFNFLGLISGIAGYGCTAEVDATLFLRADVPTYAITGRPICGPPSAYNEPTLVSLFDAPGGPLKGKLVELLDAGTGLVVASVTSDLVTGNFSFTGVGAGSYRVRITAANRIITTTGAFTVGPDQNLGDIPVSPLPVAYRAVEMLCGEAYFSDAASYSNLNVGGATMTAADLANPAFRFGSAGKTFKFVGQIPYRPELGTFGPGREIWVYLTSAFVSDVNWNSCTFVNQVAVEQGYNDGDNIIRRPFDTSVVFLQPFDGPGTAFNHKLNYISLNQNGATQQVGTFTVLPPVDIASTGDPAPAANTYPAGWMARVRADFQMVRGAYAYNAVGEYRNACQDVYTFRIHPEGEGF